MAGKVEERHFNYIGLRIIQESSALVLDQSRYIENFKNNVNPKNSTGEAKYINSRGTN